MGSKRFLLVENDGAIAKAVTYLIENRGYSVSTVGCAEDALKDLSKQTPDAIIVEANLPNMSGHALCQTLRMSEHFDTLPVLLLTVRNTELERRKAFAVGANGVLPKPFDRRSFEQALDDICTESNVA